LSNFQGLTTRKLENNQLCLEVLASAGPRIVRLSAFGKTNLFADVPNSIHTPSGEFFFRGGHRLWYAPEVMPQTYTPDNDGVSMDYYSDGMRLTGQADPSTGVTKIIEIHLSPVQPVVTLTQSLKNNGSVSIDLAPWGLTMFRLGGTVVLPQPIGNSDTTGLQNNRILSLWPYTHINDPRLILRDDFILIRASKGVSPLKLGYYNPHGWMAYWIDGILFRKTFSSTPGGAYPDGGCNTESYCNDQFVELESLGAIVKLNPGNLVQLIETWELYPGLEVPFLSKDISKTIDINPVVISD
jgi:hypothetical protein